MALRKSQEEVPRIVETKQKEVHQCHIHVHQEQVKVLVIVATNDIIRPSTKMIEFKNTLVLAFAVMCTRWLRSVANIAVTLFALAIHF